MVRFVLPLTIVALGLPAIAQTVSPAFNNPDLPAHVSAADTADPLGPLTLPAALALALGANANLSAARYELQAVDAAVLQANTLPNPSLEIGIEDTRRETRETSFQFSQPIELGGKRSARTRVAERGRDVASAELNAARADVRAAVVIAFFDVLTDQERLTLANSSAELAQRAVTVAARRVAAGKVSPVEETRARVAASGVRLELIQARSALASARKRLSATWGSRTPRFERVDGQLEVLPDLPDPSALSRQLSGAPTIVRARHDMTRKQAQAQLERSRRLPDLTVSVGVKHSAETGRDQALLGVSIPLPLFDGNRGNVLESLRRVDKAREELSATEIRLDGELAQAWEKLNIARQEAESLQKEMLPGAQSAYHAATTGFEFGKFDFLDVLDAQRTLLQAKSRYLNALSEAHRAAAEIDRILGETLHITRQ